MFQVLLNGHKWTIYSDISQTPVNYKNESRISKNIKLLASTSEPNVRARAGGGSVLGRGLDWARLLHTLACLRTRMCMGQPWKLQHHLASACTGCKLCQAEPEYYLIGVRSGAGSMCGWELCTHTHPPAGLYLSLVRTRIRIGAARLNKAAIPVCIHEDHYGVGRFRLN